MDEATIRRLEREWAEVQARPFDESLRWILVSVFGDREAFLTDPVFHARVKQAEGLIAQAEAARSGTEGVMRVQHWYAEGNQSVHAPLIAHATGGHGAAGAIVAGDNPASP